MSEKKVAMMMGNQKIFMSQEYKEYAIKRKEALMPNDIPLNIELKTTKNGVLVFFIQGLLRGDRISESFKPAKKFLYIENNQIKLRGHGSWDQYGFSCNSHDHVKGMYTKRHETRNIGYSEITSDCVFVDLPDAIQQLITHEYKLHWGIVDIIE